MDIKQMDIYEYEERNDIIIPANTFVKNTKNEDDVLKEWRELLNEEFVVAFINSEDFIRIPLSYLGKMPDAIKSELIMGGYIVKKKWFGRGYIIKTKNKTSP